MTKTEQVQIHIQMSSILQSTTITSLQLYVTNPANTDIFTVINLNPNMSVTYNAGQSSQSYTSYLPYSTSVFTNDIVGKLVAGSDTGTASYISGFSQIPNNYIITLNFISGSYDTAHSIYLFEFDIDFYIITPVTYVLTLAENFGVVDNPHDISFISGVTDYIYSPTPTVHKNFSVFGITNPYSSSATATFLPARNIVCTRQTNQASELKFTIPKSYESYVQIGNVVSFWYLGNLAFTGTVQSFTKKSTMEYDIIAYDGLFTATLTSNQSISKGYISKMVSSLLSLANVATNLLTSTSNFQDVTLHLQTDNILYVADLMALNTGYYIYMNNNNQANISQYAELLSLSSTIITENQNGVVLVDKKIDDNYQYSEVDLNYSQYYISTVVTEKTFDSLHRSYFVSTIPNVKQNIVTSGTTGSNIKKLNEYWLTSSSVATAQGYADTIYNLFKNGWQYATILTPSYYDITKQASYQINCADGTTFYNLTLIKVVISNSGLEATFANVDVTPLSYLPMVSVG